MMTSTEITVGSISNIKEEPPVEFLLILPAYEETAIKHELKEFSVIIKKFHKQKWLKPAELFQPFVVRDHCNLVTRRTRNLVRLKEKCKGPNQGKRAFKCRECNKICKGSLGLSNHMKAIKELRFECIICGQKFGCFLLRAKHVANDHGNKYNCNQCPYVAKGGQKLTQHKKIHNKTILCETCKKLFPTKDGLKFHQEKLKHGRFFNVPNVNCHICQKSFLSTILLKIHLKKVHEHSNAHCDYCSKVFKNKDSLKCHIFNHLKMPCTICGKQYNKFRISAHYREHREGNKFECDFCGKRFKLKHHVTQHMNCHVKLSTSRSKKD